MSSEELEEELYLQGLGVEVPEEIQGGRKSGRVGGPSQSQKQPTQVDVETEPPPGGDSRTNKMRI